MLNREQTFVGKNRYTKEYHRFSLTWLMDQNPHVVYTK